EAGGTWVQLCIHRTGALRLPREPPARPFFCHSSAHSFFEASSLGISRQRCLNDLVLLPVNDGVWRVDDDLVVRLEAGDNLYRIAKIMAGSHGSEHDFPVFNNADT